MATAGLAASASANLSAAMSMMAGMDLSAVLALGVSNVNELDSQRALHTLKSWVQHNPKFHGLEIRVDEYSDGTLMDEVMQLMLQAESFDPTDSDVQVP